MRKPVLTLAVAVFLAGTASAQTVENGYPIGSLAVAAIERQDWATAERLLTESRAISRSDPARLINLSRVYLATGRPEQARQALERALASDRHVEVETASGQILSTRELSKLALERVPGETRTAAR